VGGQHSEGPQAPPLASDLLWTAVEQLSDFVKQLAMLAAEVRRLEEEVFTAELDSVRLSSALLRRIATALGSERDLDYSGDDGL